MYAQRVSHADVRNHLIASGIDAATVDEVIAFRVFLERWGDPENASDEALAHVRAYAWREIDGSAFLAIEAPELLA